MKPRTDEQGFSLIDVMIGLVILMVGCVALAGAMTVAVLRIDESEDQLLAKQVAVASMESIFSAREIDALGFASIRNGSGSPDGNGVGSFITGLHDVYDGPGQDGVVGTNDDANGPDGTAGNADDHQILQGFKRNIVITDLTDPDLNVVNMKTVTVEIHYKHRNFPRQVVLRSWIADYSVQQ